MRKAQIFTLGQVPQELVDECAEVAVSKFGLIPEFSGYLVPSSVGARGNQLNAKVLLEQVAMRRKLDVALALTGADIYVKELNFVFGVASSLLRAAVVSFARLLDSDAQKVISRWRKEVTHELGHVFGLAHCTNPVCVMSFSNSVDDVDEKSEEFCPECTLKLKMLLGEP